MWHLGNRIELLGPTENMLRVPGAMLLVPLPEAVVGVPLYRMSANLKRMRAEANIERVLDLREFRPVRAHSQYVGTEPVLVIGLPQVTENQKVEEDGFHVIILKESGIRAPGR